MPLSFDTRPWMDPVGGDQAGPPHHNVSTTGRTNAPGHLRSADIKADVPFAIVPPHWSHRRHESYASYDDRNPKSPPIVLEDNTGADSERSSSCWARCVSIDDFVVLSGSFPAVGTFVVWNCKVDTLEVSHFRPSRIAYGTSSYLRLVNDVNDALGWIYHDTQKVYDLSVALESACAHNSAM